MARYRALITGASAGLGAEFARQLAHLGVDLILTARDETRLHSLASELRAITGRTIDVLPADLLTDDGRRAVSERLTRGDVDILINNAGFGLGEPFESSRLEDERRLLELLVGVPMELAHAAVPGMRARGRGWILNVASMAAFIPAGTYSAAKAYLVSLSRALHARYRSDGITVSALCPGMTHTEFHDRMGERDLGLPAWAWGTAPVVVRDGIRGLRRGQSVIVTDATYRVARVVGALIPQSMLAGLSAPITPRRTLPASRKDQP